MGQRADMLALSLMSMACSPILAKYKDSIGFDTGENFRKFVVAFVKIKFTHNLFFSCFCFSIRNVSRKSLHF